jgi:hypothetical protein
MAAIIGFTGRCRSLTVGSRLAKSPGMLERFRMPGPALGAARLFGLLAGVAFTWACAAFGVMALIDNALVSYRCPAPTKMATQRILEVQSGLAQHQITESRCPTPGDLISGKYMHPGSLVDPWGTGIAYWCHGEDLEIRSAGPDKLFNTDDDITNEP